MTMINKTKGIDMIEIIETVKLVDFESNQNNWNIQNYRNVLNVQNNQLPDHSARKLLFDEWKYENWQNTLWAFIRGKDPHFFANL